MIQSPEKSMSIALAILVARAGGTLCISQKEVQDFRGFGELRMHTNEETGDLIVTWGPDV